MQVLCIASNDDQAPVACPSCGQKYTVYYSRFSAPECETALVAVLTALLGHHASDATPAAHLERVFNVPAWHGVAHMSGAALLSGAPVRRPVDGDLPPDLRKAS